MWQEIMFWAAVWTFASVASALRAVHDRRYDDINRLVIASIYGGTVGMAVVMVWVARSGDHVGNWPRYLGVATFVGLGGTNSEKIISFAIDAILARLRFALQLSERKPMLGDGTPLDDGDPADDSDRS